MSGNPQFANILNQPASLRKVADRQFGEGSADLARAADTLRGAKRIIFTGMGSSLFAAIPAASALVNAGFAAQAIDASELLYYHHRLLDPDTAAVLISRSGETVEVAKLVPAVRDTGAKMVAVTNVPDSLLGRDLDHRILVGSDHDQMVAIQSYTATLATLLLLTAAVVNEPQDVVRAALDRSIRSLEAAITENLGDASAWTGFFQGGEVIYLLGRGPSMASVMEGSLMLNEAARIPSVAMSAAQFRHGPVEVVDERFRAIVFTSQEATRDLDLALAEDIARMGGKVRLCAATGTPAPFEPMVEIIPVQVGACRLAESKGLHGQFRYAPQVTTTEAGFQGLT